MAMTNKEKKLTEAELVDQQQAPVAAQPASPEDMAAVQQPVEPAGTEAVQEPTVQDEISTPQEPQVPVAGMNDDGTFTPPAPGMVPVGWANPSDLAAAVAMATGDAEAAETAPDAQVTEQPVVSPEGQAVVEGADAGAEASADALTAEDQNMMESLTHADFELLREYRKYREAQEEECAITAQNEVQEAAAKALSGFGEVHTEFKDAAAHVDFGAKCIVIISSDPLVRADLEAKLRDAGFSLVSFLPGISENPEKFETKIIASKNAFEQKELAWKNDSQADHKADLAELEKPLEAVKEEKPMKESATEDPVSQEAGKEVAEETEDLQDEAMEPAIERTKEINESKESLTDAIRRMFRESEESGDEFDGLADEDPVADPETDDLLGSEEADVSGLFQDVEEPAEEFEAEEAEDGSLEADLEALFDTPVEPDDETDAIDKAEAVLDVIGDHLEELDDQEEPEEEVIEDDLIAEDEPVDGAEDPAAEIPAADEEEIELPESVQRIPVKLPSRPFSKETKPSRQVLRAQEKIQYPAGSRPQDSLVEAYETSLSARRAAVAKFRESLKANRKPATQFTEALRQPVRTSAKLQENYNPNSWKNNRYAEKMEEVEALDYKALLRNGFLG